MKKMSVSRKLKIIIPSIVIVLLFVATIFTVWASSKSVDPSKEGYAEANHEWVIDVVREAKCIRIPGYDGYEFDACTGNAFYLDKTSRSVIDAEGKPFNIYVINGIDPSDTNAKIECLENMQILPSWGDRTGAPGAIAAIMLLAVFPAILLIVDGWKDDDDYVCYGFTTGY